VCHVLSLQADKVVAEEKLEAARPALEQAEAALQTIKPVHIATGKLYNYLWQICQFRDYVGLYVCLYLSRALFVPVYLPGSVVFRIFQ